MSLQRLFVRPSIAVRSETLINFSVDLDSVSVSALLETQVRLFEDPDSVRRVDCLFCPSFGIVVVLSISH